MDFFVTIPNQTIVDVGTFPVGSVLSVAGRVGNVVLQIADIANLQTTLNGLGDGGFNGADVVITGGTIDSTTIGGTTPATGTFTSLSASSLSAGSVSTNTTATNALNGPIFLQSRVIIASNNDDILTLTDESSANTITAKMAGLALGANQLVISNGGEGQAVMRLGQKDNTEVVWGYNVDQNNGDAIDDATNSAFKFSIQGSGNEGYNGLHLQGQDAQDSWNGSTIWAVDITGNSSFSKWTLPNSSMIQQGTFDNGHGAANGVSLICTVSYELNWQAGYLSLQSPFGGSTLLFAGGNNILTMQNGSSPQNFQVYGTYADADNGTLIGIGSYDGSTHYILVAGNGSYVNKNLNVGTVESGNLNLVTDNTVRWIITSQGNLWSQQDNIVEIGDSTGGRPANIYVGTKVQSPLFEGTQTSAGTAATGSIVINGAPTDGQTVIINDGADVYTYTYRNSPVVSTDFSLTNDSDPHFLSNVLVSTGIGMNVVYDENVTITLTNNTPGIAGNVAITGTASSALTFTGMSGGTNPVISTIVGTNNPIVINDSGDLALSGDVSLTDLKEILSGTGNRTIYGGVFVITRNLTASNYDNSNPHGFDENSTINNISSSGNVGVNAFDARTQFTGNQNYNHYVAFQHDSIHGTSGTTTNLVTVTSGPAITAGTVTNRYALDINDVIPSGGGTLVNNYGINIAQMVGGTNNYGVFCETDSVFNCTLTVGTSGNATTIEVFGRGGFNIVSPTQQVIVGGNFGSGSGGLYLEGDGVAGSVIQSIYEGEGYSNLYLQPRGGNIGIGGSPVVPNSATDTGVKGTIAYDDNFIYICIETNSWKRAALTTW